MTQPHKTPPNAESGKEVAKQNGFAILAGNKFSPQYWAARVYRPAYVRDGQRGEVAEFWARIQHDGRREAVGLGTNDKQDASRRAANLYKAVKSAGWQAALAKFAPDRATVAGAPTVGELIATVAQAADVSPKSLHGYSVCLRKLAADAVGVKATASRFDYHGKGHAEWLARVNRIRLDKLTPARIQAALNARIAKARGNPLAEQKTRTTAASVLRQAKALFNPELKLPFDRLPNPFEGVRVKVGTPRKYSSTIDAAALMRAGRSELAESDPEAYKAFLLALGAGLRKAEIDCLQWQQIDTAANVIRVTTSEHFATKTDSSEGEVFVDPGLVAELERFRTNATSLFILESPFAPRPESPVAYYRAAATFDRLTKWLRGKGIMGHKPIHTLRKEFGSLVCASADIHTASRQLRHASIALTATYYVDGRRRVAPPVGAFLSEPTTQNQKANQ